MARAQQHVRMQDERAVEVLGHLSWVFAWVLGSRTDRDLSLISDERAYRDRPEAGSTRKLQVCHDGDGVCRLSFCHRRLRACVCAWLTDKCARCHRSVPQCTAVYARAEVYIAPGDTTGVWTAAHVVDGVAVVDGRFRLSVTPWTARLHDAKRDGHVMRSRARKRRREARSSARLRSQVSRRPETSLCEIGRTCAMMTRHTVLTRMLDEARS